MALINFGYRVDMYSIDPPTDPSAYIVAYDLDGVLKQKDYLGNVTILGGGSIGPQGVAGPVGPGGLTWSGYWLATQSYNVNYAVGYASASWWCIADVIGASSNNGPDIDTTHWALLASQGSPGPMGPGGTAGLQGAQGATGGVGLTPSLQQVGNIGSSFTKTTIDYTVNFDIDTDAYTKIERIEGTEITKYYQEGIQIDISHYCPESDVESQVLFNRAYLSLHQGVISTGKSTTIDFLEPTNLTYLKVPAKSVDGVYTIATLDDVSFATPSWQEVTDVGAVTQNEITIGDVTNYTSISPNGQVYIVNNTNSEYIDLHPEDGIYLQQTIDGNVTFKAQNLTASIILQAPNKPVGEYIIATLDDIGATGSFVPYTGAISSVNLGANQLDVEDGNEMAYFSPYGIEIYENGTPKSSYIGTEFIGVQTGTTGVYRNRVSLDPNIGVGIGTNTNYNPSPYAWIKSDNINSQEYFQLPDKGGIGGTFAMIDDIVVSSTPTLREVLVTEGRIPFEITANYIFDSPNKAETIIISTTSSVDLFLEDGVFVIGDEIEIYNKLSTNARIRVVGIEAAQIYYKDEIIDADISNTVTLPLYSKSWLKCVDTHVYELVIFDTTLSIEPLEVNLIDRTVWNNGKNNEPTNTSFGEGALISAIFDEGIENTAFGYDVMRDLTNGSESVAFGYNALKFNTTGSANTAIGAVAIRNNLSGVHNTGVGASSLYNGITASENTAIGAISLFSNKGDYNTAVGFRSLDANQIGNGNIGIGHNAGRALIGNFSNLNSNNSIFIGRDTKSASADQTNEIVIGYNTFGTGSNTVTIGNSDITITQLRGAVYGGSFIKIGGSSSQVLLADGSVGTLPTTPSLQSVATVGNTYTGELLAGSNLGFKMSDYSGFYLKWGGFDEGTLFRSDTSKTLFGVASNGGYIYFGSTSSGYSSSLRNNLITANRDLEFPDKSGIIATTDDISGFVPYTGAISSVNLGANQLDVEDGNELAYFSPYGIEIYENGTPKSSYIGTEFIGVQTGTTGVYRNRISLDPNIGVGIGTNTSFDPSPYAWLRADNITTEENFQFPDTGGVGGTLPISVNGEFADSSGNIVIGSGATGSWDASLTIGSTVIRGSDQEFFNLENSNNPDSNISFFNSDINDPYAKFESTGGVTQIWNFGLNVWGSGFSSPSSEYLKDRISHTSTTNTIVMKYPTTISGEQFLPITVNGATANSAGNINIQKYKSYVVWLAQSGASAPTVLKVLENDLGSASWGYNAPGNYVLTITGAFPDVDKAVAIHKASWDSTNVIKFLEGVCIDADTYVLNTRDYLGSFQDGLLDDYVEIRVYT